MFLLFSSTTHHKLKLLFLFCLIAGLSHAQQTRLSKQERNYLLNSINELDKHYDPNAKMLIKHLNGWNYHTDATSGDFHDVRSSLFYAIKLLDYGGSENANRAIDIVRSTIELQDTNSRSTTCGVWPYYKEEPLATKKSPVDFNWADFNAVSLLDIWIEHSGKIPADLKPKIQNAILLASQSIQRRNVGPSYTNIALMGTYVTYMTGTLFNHREILQYAQNRLKTFYEYTIQRGGFEEYNSPTYTIVALDELNRMQRNFKEAGPLAMVDSLCSLSWNIIARHYHKPTGQWVGPHSRAYSPLVDSSFSVILYRASGGKIGTPAKSFDGDVKMRHHIPDYLLHYFMQPQYPRTESDIFVAGAPAVKGTAYMTSKYALATANRASLWNQRHPLLLYWGTPGNPKYCQLRFLHDFFDFSSADFYSIQHENRVLAGINFVTNGGDKHISIDRLKNGEFKARDLRLRFEFPASTEISNLRLPVSNLQPFHFMAGDLPIYIHPYILDFADLTGKWELGHDSTKTWIDFIIYSGDQKDFDLSKISRAVLGFAIAIDETKEDRDINLATLKEQGDRLEVQWGNLLLEIGTRPTQQPPNM